MRALPDEFPLLTVMPLSTVIFVAGGTWRQHRDAVLLVSRFLHLTWSDLFGREHMSVLMCPFTSSWKHLAMLHCYLLTLQQ
jgi:hypothetical protein